MDAVAEHRATAEECRRLAKVSADPVEQAQYEKMASSWDDLAASMEVLRSRVPAKDPPRA